MPSSHLPQFARELHCFVSFFFFCKIVRTSAWNQQYLSDTNILISVLIGERGKEKDEKTCLKNIFLAYSSVNHFISAEKAAHNVVSVTTNDKYLIKWPYRRHSGCFGYGLVTGMQKLVRGYKFFQTSTPFKINRTTYRIFKNSILMQGSANIS